MYLINYSLLLSRPGGELVAGEDEIDGLKRSMTEVSILIKHAYLEAKRLTINT